MKSLSLSVLSHQIFKWILFILTGITVFLIISSLEKEISLPNIYLLISFFVTLIFTIFYVYVNLWRPLYLFDIKVIENNDTYLKTIKELKEFRIDSGGFVVEKTTDLVIKLSENIHNATDFIEDIEKGKLTSSYKGFDQAQNDSNMLAKALMSMRDQMQSITEKEKERSWITEGLARFADILRHGNSDAAQLYDNILINVVKYIEANQGGLYIIDEKPDGEQYFELVSFYAYKQEKIYKQNISYTGRAYWPVLFGKGCYIPYRYPSELHYHYFWSRRGLANLHIDRTSKNK